MQRLNIFNGNHGLIPLEKCHFFEFLSLLNFVVYKGVFSFDNIVIHIFDPYLIPIWSIFDPYSLTKTMEYPLWKNPSFSTFLTYCFYSLHRRFFYLKYHETHFPGTFCQKIKRMEQLLIFDQDHGLSPFKKIPIFRLLLTSCFYSLERRFLFHSRISWNTLCCPILSKIKKKMEKLPILDQNHWRTPLEKSNFFLLFWLLDFIACEGVS